MSKAPAARRKPRPATPKPPGTEPFTPPALPPETQDERELSRHLAAQLQELTIRLRQRNLESAILLAQMAAAGRGPLVDHFCEIGRRYGHTLRAPQKPRLEVVGGGGAS